MSTSCSGDFLNRALHHQYEVFDEAGEPLTGLEVMLVLLAYENYVDATPPYQLFNYSDVGESACPVVLLCFLTQELT